MRDGCGMGGWWEGPPVRGPAGLRLPLVLPLPRYRGGGVLPVRRWRRVGGGGGYVWSIPMCPGSLACGQRGMRYGLL